jgi:hypothetical protein
MNYLTSKILFVLLVLLISCGGNQPSDNISEIIDGMNELNYDKLESLMTKKAFKKLKRMRRSDWTYSTKNGTIDYFEVTAEKIRNNTAVVKGIYYYKDGSSFGKESKLEFVQIDGKWLLN